MQLVFAMGHAWHDVLQAVIKEATPEAEIELKVRSGRMVGHCDVKYPDLTVDIKTKARPGSQIKGYVGQVHCYCYANGTSKGAFLTAYKSTGMLTLEEFELQDEIMERLEFSLKTTDQYIDDGILPPHFQGAEPQHSRCTSCHFKENCWDES
jgi:CRISPR/Cas system-associated exonuclease Cas4 (RecB family)